MSIRRARSVVRASISARAALLSATADLILLNEPPMPGDELKYQKIEDQKMKKLMRQQAVIS